MMKVRKIIRAMKEGRYKTLEEREKEKQARPNPFYLIWNDEKEDIVAERAMWINSILFNS